MNSAASQPTVLCVGRLYCDFIFTDVPRLPTMGKEVFAGSMGVHAGGGAYITAAHLASLNHRTALSSFFPAPPFDKIVVDELQRSGLVLDLCRAPGQWESQVTVAMTGGGDRAFLTHRSGPAFPDIGTEDIRRIGATHLHIGELATLIERPELIQLAREVGMTISLDCGWDDTLKAKDVSICLSGVDIFMPNEAEMLHLLSIGVIEPFAPLTVVKKGANGATAISGEIKHSAPAETVDVVDTTGAGDAFNAGFISAWLDGNLPDRCLHAGNALGAAAITRRGGAQVTPNDMNASSKGSEAAE